MQPAYNISKRKKLKNILVISALSLALLLIVLLIAASLGGGEKPETTKLSADSTPTPFGTEVITPFYTPTPVPTVNPATVNTPVPTLAPTPTMVPIDTSKMYKKGDSGDDIVIIQTMLMEIGLDVGSVDGQFGDQLKSAVKNFQLYVELDNDGIAGPTTLTRMVNNWTQSFPLPLAEEPVLYGITIGIDAGHQRHGNDALEPISPDSTQTKKKTSSGTSGTWSGVDEYVINLQVALRLKQELEALGATVVMTRETHDVDISNSERAIMMNEAKVDCWIRIHANGSTDPDQKGMFMLIPEDGSMDTGDKRVYTKSQELASTLLKTTIASTGASNAGITKRSDLAGFNWSQVPVFLIEMGHMTNEGEERLLINKQYQKRIVSGLVEGFVEYYNKN
ncbi:MAG: N-acetylmuramoyl-L-alanine amidase [Eubacteriales bacterium]